MDLFIRQKIFSIGDKYRVTDGEGNVVFEVKTKIFSFRQKKTIMGADGQPLLYLYNKLIDIMPQYYITDAEDNKIAKLKSKFSLRKSFHIDSLDDNHYDLNGDFMGWNWDITKNGEVIASISKVLFRLTDCYRMVVNDEKEAAFVVACVIAVDNLFHKPNKG